MQLVLATRNEHKLREFARMAAALDIQPLPDGVALPPETGETFRANALAKARAAALAIGRPVIADDSGIEAEALGGAPGVRSARFAGEHASDEENLALLIERAPAGSRLEYVCALAHVEPATGRELIVEGRCSGTLDPAIRGDRGFGYDPCFVPDDGDGSRTMAELNEAEKDSISHRGEAFRRLLALLGPIPVGGPDA